ncbi:MAG: DMT family transporter [Leucobacter sp.]
MVDGRASAIMFVLCLVWGMQQVAIKVASPDVSALLQVSIRSGVAALLVWIVAKFVLRERWLGGALLPAGIVVGVFFAAEFLFLAEGLNRTSASRIAVFLYTAPLWAAVGLHFKLPEERLSARQWVGIGTAFVGIVVALLAPSLASGEAGAVTPESVLGDLMGLCGGAAWGFTTVMIRVSRLSEAPPTQTLFYQLAVAFVLLTPLTVLTGQLRFTSTPTAWVSLGFQSVVVVCASYLVWFWLLRRYFAAQLGVLSFLTPLFGVVFGVVLLREPLTLGFGIGAALVLVGLLIVNLRGWLPFLQRLSGR